MVRDLRWGLGHRRSFAHVSQHHRGSLDRSGAGQADSQPKRPAAAPVAAPSSPSRPAKAERAKPSQPPRAATRFEFADDEVEGNLQRPDVDIVVGGPARAKHKSLIEIRGSFVPSVAKSLEEL